MFGNIILLIITAANVPNSVDLYIQSGLSRAEVQKQIHAHYPIYAYANDTAIYLNSAGQAVPATASLLVKNLDPSRIAIVWLYGDKNIDFPAPEYSGQYKVIYQDKLFWLIDADDLGNDLLRRSGVEVTPISLKPLSAAKGVELPTQPEGLEITRAAVSHITPEKVFAYDQSLANFTSRFTFDNRLLEAQDWSQQFFNSWGLTTSYFPYNALGSVMHYYGIKQDAELASYFGFIYRKENGVWKTYHANIMVLDTKYSSDGNTLYLCGRGGLVGWNTYPSDYNTWTIIDTGAEKDLFGIYAEGNRIWAVGKEGTLVYSNDGGDSWQTIPTGMSVGTLEEVGKFHVGTGSDQKYFIVGGGGTVLRSDDGISWTRLTTLPVANVWLRDICGYENPVPTSHGEIMVVGGNGTILTSPDGGSTWNYSQQAIDTWMHCGHHGWKSWVEGTSGDLATSDDFGQTWTMQSTPTQFILTNMSFPTESVSDVAYICGQYNVFMKTTSGGVTWQILPNPTSDYQSRDLIAELPGTKYPDEIIIVCAHQDSISDNPYLAAPGADDNGTGSAAVMAIAEEMSKMHFERTLRFILFSGEEQGLLGSTAYANQMAEEGQNIIAVLNADMIGYKDDAINDFDLWVTTVGVELQNFVAACAAYYLPQTPIHIVQGSAGGSDHAPFSAVGYQAVLLIEHETEQWYPHYHTQQDLPQYLNADFLAMGTQIILSCATELAVPLGGKSGTNQGNPYAFPNPLHKDKGWQTITFTNLIPGDKIQVYDLNGDLVWEDTSTNTNLIWQSPKLSTGVYIYNIVQNSKKYQGKLAVIK